MNRVLVVDDRELMRDAVSTMLTRAGWSVVGAASGQAALRLIAERRPDVVLTDLKMPGMTGLELLAAIREIDEQLPVVLMTAYATVQTAVEAMKCGAYDYITKPFEGEQLVLTIRRAIERSSLIKENAQLKTQARGGSARGADCPALIGESTIMRTLRQQIDTIAPSQSTVLITGESGSGKEVVAQIIHAKSSRSKAPMLALNCAALSASLLESELFGHERGAFTGADKLRKGRFELADDGTLMLDEVTEIPPQIQAKLLRVLQEQAFERVGSSTTRRTDVRVIATTNRDLQTAVRNGQFRQDLFFRLHVLPIHVPPLRDRLDDVSLLCEHFLEQIVLRQGGTVKRFDESAIELMQSYPWPGNVRELYNICERALIFSRDEVIPAEMIRPWLTAPVVRRRAVRRAVSVPVGGNGSSDFGDAVDSGLEDTFESVPDFSVGGDDGGVGVLEAEAAVSIQTSVGERQPVQIQASGRTLEEVERDLIVATLERHNRHRQRTAKELGIGVRTLGLKLRKWKEMRLVSEDL